MMLNKLLFSIFVLKLSSTQKLFRILVLTEENQSHVLETTAAALKVAEEKYPSFHFDQVHVSNKMQSEEDFFEQLCRELSPGASLVLDITPGGCPPTETACRRAQLPYLRASAALATLAAVDACLAERRASDVAFISTRHRGLDEALQYFIGRSNIRLIILNGSESNALQNLAQLRPVPSYVVMYGPASDIISLYDQAVELVTMAERWLLVLEDSGRSHLNSSLLPGTVVMTAELSCPLAGEAADCRFNDTQLRLMFFHHIVLFLARLASFLNDNGVEVSPRPAAVCTELGEDLDNLDAFYTNITQVMETMGSDDLMDFDLQDGVLYLRNEFNIWTVGNTSWTLWAQYQDNKLLFKQDGTSSPVQRFFRIGIIESVAWSYRRPDEEGRPQWEGYCVDLLEQLAASMSFHYELVVAEGGPGARRPDGTWDGVLGDLVDGKTDIIIAPLSVTSEREDVIDFVTPYFEKSGISIVIRKPARKTSLFKFMTVLKLEVWLSILASLAITSLMLWLLDRCSPYSYRNNKARLPRPCRDFTLTESLWFAMTSITPQGGGEAPRALSGRTLVAAYWLFVVLVLATFTANLAAFLTVERMESPVSSLEQLGRQSRISYTVVNNSDTHEYFRNMKNAEYILHNVWKEMALNASSNPSQYRVWDYPIKEQYENILLAITETGPVENETVGFQKVLDDEESEFAFIHDSARIRHEVTLNCLLAEVGDVFAERELAIAVQQGSHLYAEISGRILELQKNLYFEGLTEKYWNSTKKRSCSNNNQSEGITLESLGGIFIAMVFGLVLAMITLSGEIFYYQKRHNSEVTTLKTNFRDNSTSKNDILKMEFPTKTIHGNQQAFHISVFPKNHFY